MQDTTTQDVQENGVPNVNQVANTQTNVQPTPFNEKIFNQIADIIKKDKYTAQMIKQASLRWGDVENPELSQMQVIGKIAEYFQSNPKEKIDVQTVSALANMVKAGGLDFSVTNPKMKNLLALSKFQ